VVVVVDVVSTTFGIEFLFSCCCDVFPCAQHLRKDCVDGCVLGSGLSVWVAGWLPQAVVISATFPWLV